MVYPKNTSSEKDIPDLYHGAKERLADAEDEVRALREQILKTGKTIIIGRRYRVAVDSVIWKTIDKDRLRLFMSDKMIEDCMREQPRTFVRLKSLTGKPVKARRSAGRQGGDLVSDEE